MSVTELAARGLTVADVAARYRVSPDKVRAWIARGELAAVNTSSCRKPRWVVSPDAITAFEKKRGTRAPAVRHRQRGRARGTDYYPND